MTEPLSYVLPVAPATSMFVEISTVAQIDQVRREVKRHTAVLNQLRTTRDKILDGLRSYLSTLQSLRALTTIISACAPYSIDKEYKQDYVTFNGHADDACTAAEGKVSANGGSAYFPLPATHKSLLDSYQAMSDAATDYACAFDEWPVLADLPASELELLDVQQALESLNTDLAYLLDELRLGPNSGNLDTMIHDDWWDGKATTLTAADAGSIFDLMLVYTDRDRFTDVDLLLANVIGLKCVVVAKDATDHVKGVDLKTGLKAVNSLTKVIKYFTVTNPVGSKSVEVAAFKDWERSFADWQKTPEWNGMKDEYDNKLYLTKGKLGVLGSTLDFFAFMCAAGAYAQTPVEKRTWADLGKLGCDGTSMLASAWVTSQRVWLGVAGKKWLDPYDKYLGPLGPICSIISGSLTLYTEWHKAHPDYLVMGTTAMSIAGSSLTLASKLLSVPAVAGTAAGKAIAGYLGAEVLAKVAFYGEMLSGGANIIVSAVAVADALYRFNSLCDSERLKNQHVVAQVRGFMKWLREQKVPMEKSGKLVDFFGITANLDAMEAMIPTQDVSLYSATVGAVSNYMSGQVQLNFFGLPAIFGVADSDGTTPSDLAAFKTSLKNAFAAAARAGNADGAKSDGDDYARCRAMLTSLGIDGETAAQMLYWSSAQLEAIHNDPMMSMAFWIADTF